MKSNFLKNIKVLGLGALMATMSACDAGFEEVNTDPNRPSKVDAGFVMTNAQKMAMDNIWDEWTNGRFGMLYSQYWAQNAYSTESLFQYRVGTNNNQWSTYYAGVLRDLEEVIRISADESLSPKEKAAAEDYALMARILKVWQMQIVTDIYGPVPYSEALQIDEIISPVYDEQAAIYDSMLKELDTVIGLLDNANGTATAGDLIYHGDMMMWKKFANALKMRLAIRMADVDETRALALINEAVTSGTFTSNDDNALLPYASAAPSNNPLNEDRKTREDFAVSNTLVDALQVEVTRAIGAGGTDSTFFVTDPRLDFYAEPAATSGDYVGLAYGLDETNSAAVDILSVSQPSKEVLAATAPGVFIDYAEVLFIQAEAAQRAGDATSAEAHFEAAIKASMLYWGVDETAADDYIAAEITYDAGNWNESIGKQKWVALYMQGLQGWFEYRRLDFGNVLYTTADEAIGTSGPVPTRKEYPTDEQTLNEKNYKMAKTLLGADDMETRLWWDVNPAQPLILNPDTPAAE